MTFAIMIATHNRCADLRRTCAALQLLDPPPDEVLICADGCTDDTVPMLRREFPNFVVLENAVRQGSVAARDRMLRLASADVVVSLDGDNCLSLEGALARQLRPLLARRGDPHAMRQRWDSVRRRFDWSALAPAYRGMFEHAACAPLPHLAPRSAPVRARAIGA